MEGVGDEVEDKLSPVIEMLRQYLMNISESGSDRNLVDQGKWQIQVISMYLAFYIDRFRAA